MPGSQTLCGKKNSEKFGQSFKFSRFSGDGVFTKMDGEKARFGALLRCYYAQKSPVKPGVFCLFGENPIEKMIF